jgi:DNA helicase-2/ATP-dependent DNA helicase PcrA
MRNHLEDLNPAQKEAALHKHGPLLIVAGAGAGKTKTITHRIIHLVESGVAPENILAITFTNKAAKEMRERVHGALAQEFGNNFSQEKSPFVSTFHSLGVKILKEHARHAETIKHFTILDEDDGRAMIKQAVKDIGLDPKQFEPRKFKHIISKKKNEFFTAQSFGRDAVTNVEKMTARVWAKYEELKKKEQAFDFDDLLVESVRLLQNNPEILNWYQEKWKYIHIDEYQDTNEVQFKLAELLAKKYKNICVVGDGDQNIYGWRGANIKNILNFEKDYPDAKSVMLEENYRSTSNILEAANEIIKKNLLRKDKNLFTKKGTGEKLTVFEGFDENEEGRFVADTIYDLVSKGTPVSDIAVLYRANFQSRVLEEALLMKNIPYQVLGTKFFERKEIKDVLAYVRAARISESLSDIKRIINFPTRGIGKTTIAKLFAGQQNELPTGMQKKIQSFYGLLDNIGNYIEEHMPSEIIKYIILESGIEKELKAGTDEDLERLENIRELVTLSLKYDLLPMGEGIDKLIEDAALASDQDSLDHKDKKDGVRLMTVHASKGLEFKYVFVTGLEQDLFPHKKDGNASEEEREEERRLFYVALTRAKEKLYLSYASIRTIFGSRQINAPSEFLYDIPEHLVEREYARNTKTIYFD